ncbi:MAG: carboxypeptidase-like regulatory domain-containing protein [Bacteroidales bacterium]|nr:carboxypeptidase-like regulatory domain-containing protein [Bacteroidales bacterium]
MLIKKTFIIILFFGVWQSVFSQKDSTDFDVIQFSGVVVNADDLEPVSFSNIMIQNTRRGTISDYYGYFSFVALKSDTILFSAIGYKQSSFIIPDTISGNRYSLIHVMNSDTILLSPTIIYPWPTEEDFKKAFVALEIPDDDIAIAHKNLAKAEMKERAMNYKMDGSMNYKNYIDKETSKLYYAGQTQPISLLNPFAWAQFIKAWKEGKFKNDK